MTQDATGKIAALEEELEIVYDLVRQANAKLDEAYAKIDEQQHELAKYAGDYLDSMRAEGGLTAEVKRLRIELDQERLQRKLERAELHAEIERANLRDDARWNTFHTEFQAAFLKMGFDRQSDGFMKEGADFVKANPGTVEASKRARKVLRTLLDFNAFWSEQALVRLAPNDRGVSWNAKLDYWSKRYDQIAEMTPAQLESWKKFRVFVAWYNSTNHRAKVQNESARFAARACLAAIASNSASSVLLPTLQNSDYARRAATAAEKLLSDIGETCEKLWLDIETGLAEVACKREDARQLKEDQKEAAERAKRPRETATLSGEWDDSDDALSSRNTQFQTGAPHVEETVWYDEDYDTSPRFNPANGLPMNGMWDTHGNMYGTNFNDFHF